ncbi:hypothetical protein ES705_46991 [subsurface metagenome]
MVWVSAFVTLISEEGTGSPSDDKSLSLTLSCPGMAHVIKKEVSLSASQTAISLLKEDPLSNVTTGSAIETASPRSVVSMSLYAALRTISGISSGSPSHEAGSKVGPVIL